MENKKEEMKEYLNQNKDKVVFLGTRKRLKFFVECFNSLCLNCKLKVKKKPNIELSEYCADCQKMIKDKFRDDFR